MGAEQVRPWECCLQRNLDAWEGGQASVPANSAALGVMGKEGDREWSLGLGFSITHVILVSEPQFSSLKNGGDNTLLTGWLQGLKVVFVSHLVH